MKNILIGIAVRADGNVDPSPFYCGHDGGELRRRHAALVAQNKTGARYFQIGNPMLIPLQSVPHSTEDHPDHVAAQKHRASLKAKAAGAPAAPAVQLSLAEGLAKKTKGELLAEVEAFNKADEGPIRITVDGSNTKAQIIEALLAAKQ